MKPIEALKKYKSQLGDSLWSIGGLVLMNAVAQIVLYPFLAKQLGEAGYGEMQYLLAYINIVTVSVGVAANLSRMTAPPEERMTSGGNYNLFLLLVALLGIPGALLIRRFGGTHMDVPTTVCYYALFVAMLFRYYADVAYKLTLNYRLYFAYYAIIGVGYVGGVFLFRATGIWPLAILPGEALGVLFAYIVGPTLRKKPFSLSPAWKHAWRIIFMLCLSEGMSNLIVNADRLVLKWMVGAAAVTVYYLATLVGKIMSLVTTPFNGVLIGYLARYEGRFSRRIMRFVTLGSLVVIALCTGVCVAGGYLALIWLYPEELEAVRPYLLLGSLAQVIYFTTNTVTVVLIRFAKKIYQVIISAVFAVCFFGLSIPATLYFGTTGFAVAMLITGGVRWLSAILLGYIHAFRCDKEPLPDKEPRKTPD